MRSDKYGLWKGHTRCAPPPLVGLTDAERAALLRKGPELSSFTCVPREDSGNWVIAALFLVLSNVIAFGFGFGIGAGCRFFLRAVGYGV